MSDNEVIKQMIESKADQNIRDYLNEGKSLDNTNENQQALKRYNDMTESEKQSFRSKGWKNG